MLPVRLPTADLGPRVAPRVHRCRGTLSYLAGSIPGVDMDEFWALIEASALATATPDARLGWLTDRLAERPATDVVDFALHLEDLRCRVDTWRHWGAALQICGGLCSDDGFFYFQAWLVGLGRESFDRVAADPDALADVPRVRGLAGRPLREWGDDEWPDWECLDHVAEEAYERVTGIEEGLDDAVGARGRELSGSPCPADEAWDLDDPVQVARRYPRLVALFPLRGRGAGVWETARP